MLERLTYKSALGDYGLDKVFPSRTEEMYAMRNALGKYEDLGYTPEELEKIIRKYKEVTKMEDEKVKSFAAHILQECEREGLTISEAVQFLTVFKFLLMDRVDSMHKDIKITAGNQDV